MIEHLIFRTFRSGVTPEQIATVEAASRGFASVDGVVSVSTGANLGISPRSDGFTHATVIRLVDAAALPRLVADPVHTAAAALSGPLTERVVIMDIESA